MNLRSRGSTLIELMIVCCLIALLAGVSIASTDFLYRAIIKTELDKLYALCCYAQQYAIATGIEQRITFDAIQHRYEYGDVREQLPSSVRFGFPSGAKGPPANPTGAITQPVTFASQAITFHPDGIIQPGTIYLIDTHYNSAYALSCGVAHISYLRKYRYNNSWELLA